MQSPFPKWVPEGARNRITELLGQPKLTKASRALLQRLATDPSMKSEVWEKLPAELKGHEAQIIDWAFYAVTTLPLHVRRPRPHSKSRSNWKKYAKYLETFPPPTTPLYAANYALRLAEAMAQLKPFTELLWTPLWQGDKSITFDQAAATVNQLQLLYLNASAKYNSLLASLPKVQRWDDRAHHRLCVEFLSQQFQQTVEQPCDSIVAALVDVALDLGGGISAETVRGRRRTGTIPAKSRRKSS